MRRRDVILLKWLTLTSPPSVRDLIKVDQPWPDDVATSERDWGRSVRGVTPEERGDR